MQCRSGRMPKSIPATVASARLARPCSAIFCWGEAASEPYLFGLRARAGDFAIGTASFLLLSVSQVTSPELRRVTPSRSAKSTTWRVTTVMPWTRAVTAIKASRHRGIGLGRRPGRCRRALHCIASRRSICSVPISSSRTVIAEMNRLPAGTLAAHLTCSFRPHPTRPCVARRRRWWRERTSGGESRR